MAMRKKKTTKRDEIMHKAVEVMHNVTLMLTTC